MLLIISSIFLMDNSHTNYFNFNVNFICQGYGPVADPGFSPGGSANSQKCYYFFKFVAKNCMKMKEFGPPRGPSLASPLDPPMMDDTYFIYEVCNETKTRRRLRKRGERTNRKSAEGR